jgi:hypothetical protein
MSLNYRNYFIVSRYSRRQIHDEDTNSVDASLLQRISSIRISKVVRAVPEVVEAIRKDFGFGGSCNMRG